MIDPKTGDLTIQHELSNPLPQANKLLGLEFKLQLLFLMLRQKQRKVSMSDPDLGDY